MAKILLVEDDNNLREIYEARMLAEGYTVVTASDGEAALAVAAKEKPDLIISDVMMPKISGFEMLDILRNTEGLKTTKVIMLTALGQAEDKTRADALGADKYLVKSQVTLEDIVNTARGLLTEAAAPAAEAVTATQPAPVAAPATPAPVGTPTPQPLAVVAQPAPVEPPTSSVPAQAQSVTPPQPAAPAPVISVAAQPAPVAASPPAPVQVPATPTAPAPAVAPVASTPVATPAPPTAAPTTAPTAPVAPATPAPAVPVTPPTPDLTPPVSTPAPQTQAPAAVPAPLPEQPASPANTAAIDDKVVSNAVEQLLANADQSFAESQTPAPVPAPTPTPSAGPTITGVSNASAPIAPDITAPATKEPTPPVTSISGNTVEVAGKKIIAPISKPDTKPTLDELLAKENSHEPTPAAPSAIDKTPAYTPPQPGASVTPQNSGFDPNSISL